MSKESGVSTEALTLDNLPVDIYDLLSDFLDNKSLYIFLTLSPRHITVSKHLLNQRKWRQKDMTHWADVGDLEALKYLHRLKRQCTDVVAMQRASRNGHLQVVKFLHSIGVACSVSAMEWASENGHLQVVKFLHSIGMPYDSKAIDWASHNGHLQVVKFLNSIGATCTSHAMDWASANGHLDVVKFLHSIGAPCDARAVHLACGNGHFHSPIPLHLLNKPHQCYVRI